VLCRKVFDPKFAVVVGCAYGAFKITTFFGSFIDGIYYVIDSFALGDSDFNRSASNASRCPANKGDGAAFKFARSSVSIRACGKRVAFCLERLVLTRLAER